MFSSALCWIGWELGLRAVVRDDPGGDTCPVSPCAAEVQPATVEHWICVAGVLSPKLQRVPCLLVVGREEQRNTSLPAPEGVGCQTHCKITSLHLELCKTEPRRSAASHLLTRHELPSLGGLWGGSPLLEEQVGTCQT